MERASVENDSSAGGFIDEHNQCVKKNDRGDRIASFLDTKRVGVVVKKGLMEIVITIQSNFSLLLFGLKNYEHGRGHNNSQGRPDQDSEGILQFHPHRGGEVQAEKPCQQRN